VVLFAKDPAVNPALAKAFADRTVDKTYHALTRRPARLPPRAWRVTSPVAGKPAETDFALRRVLDRALLVEARPRTGRKHQIRVHLAEAGCAILGDDLHGGRVSPGVAVPRLMLHAIRLELSHPISGGRLVMESPHPGDFRGVLSGLEKGERGRARRG